MILENNIIKFFVINMTASKILSGKWFFELPDLPFSSDALGELMSKETFSYHYDKHHRTYIDNLNKLIEGKADLKQKTLGEIIKTSTEGLFNNAAQVFNHTFFWHSLKPKGGGTPTGEIATKITESFDSFEKFKEKFKTAALTQFGSGWAWLVLNKKTKKLEVLQTSNAETPVKHNHLVPLITIDVWEHAYYIDYKNARAKYIDAFLNSMVNWNLQI